jgi:hypothetical protein
MIVKLLRIGFKLILMNQKLKLNISIIGKKNTLNVKYNEKCLSLKRSSNL